jgi:predicted RNase H-like HicB family nuclease
MPSACDKREAFAQGSASDEAIQSLYAAYGVWIASLTLAMTEALESLLII